ncbi:uncharacterized protein ACN427_014052 isoform 1-T1 [Glossina fuscipes fuscipes]
MSQRNSARVDRFAQMSKQEELIAKKRQEILEKQRTSELAKAVAAAQSLAAKLKNSNEESSQEEERADDPSVDVKKMDAEPSAFINASSISCKSSSLNSFTGKTGKIIFGQKRTTPAPPIVDQPPIKVQNSFCNDGSFLENFKKILEKQQQPKPLLTTVTESKVSINVDEEASSADNTAIAITEATQTTTTAVVTRTDAIHNSQQQPYQQQVGTIIPPPPTPPVTFAFNPALITSQNLLISQAVPDQSLGGTGTSTIPTHPVAAAAAAYFSAPPPPPTTVAAAAAAAAAAAMLMPMHAVTTASAPPPPPPPQLPLALANLTPLYMIPAPEPLQLNTIPQPKEFDLNAIPKPQMNLEAIQIPAVNEQGLNIQAMQTMQQQSTEIQRQTQPQTQSQHELTTETENLTDLSTLEDHNQLQEQHEQQQQFHHQQNSVQLHQQVVLSDDTITNTNDNDGITIQMPTTLENLIDLVADNGDAYEETLRGHKNLLHPAMWFICEKDCEKYHHYRQQVIDCRQEKLKEQQKREEAEKEIERRTKGGTSKKLISSVEEDKYDPESVISADNDSDDEYRRGMMDRNRDNIKRRIECRNELSEEERQEREAEERDAQRKLEKKKLRKSRWGGKVENANSSASTSSAPSNFGNQNKPLLTAITRNDPALLQYAKLNYGSTNLSEEDWKKCEEHYKVNLLYQDMMRKRQEIDRLARSGKFKYEYDSDEDVDGGTWEHKLRQAEMEATRAWATALTKQSEGKHHIGDFLPPEELKKFMEQYEAKKSNRQPDLSDYKEYKLKEDNKGFQMLQKLGWKEGQGLGQDGEGIVDPINKGPQREGNQGLGVQNAASPEECDNEYDAYRKRMMLAYRFRPNPLNNPRRAYY